jgi:hypothetical protein
MMKSGVLLLKKKDVQVTLDVNRGTFTYFPVSKPNKSKALRIDPHLVVALPQHDAFFPFSIDGTIFATNSAVETADWVEGNFFFFYTFKV